MLAQFPFPLRGFHSDNGSEYVNHAVAGLLNKLLVEQTKSRPRHSNDNGLAESPYLNFHRPCAVPEFVLTAQGERKRVYRWYAMTPIHLLTKNKNLRKEALRRIASLPVLRAHSSMRICSFAPLAGVEDGLLCKILLTSSKAYGIKV